MHLFHRRGLLCIRGAVGGASMEVLAGRSLRFAYVHSSLEEWLLYTPTKLVHTGTDVNSSITISLAFLHLLKSLLMMGNMHLKVVGLEFSFVLEGA